jgi:hypothetical protein
MIRSVNSLPYTLRVEDADDYAILAAMGIRAPLLVP